MKHFEFLKDLEPSPLANFWRLEHHAVPESPGVYFLVAKPGVRFTYPKGQNPIFYIGQGSSLRRRLGDHLKYANHVREDRRTTYPLFYPRYEYAGVFGGRYCFIRTWQGCTPRALEEIVIGRFADRYRAFPVANAAGSWNRIAFPQEARA